VILAVYDAANDRAFWIHVQEHAQAEASRTIVEFSSSLTIRIPVSQRITVEAVQVMARLREFAE
jgi:hypothetical protein